MNIDNKLLDEIWDKIGPQQNRTKCPFHRIENLFNKCAEVIEAGLPGDFVEAGVWKGGASALMGTLCDVEGKGRKTWSLDSFQGMSVPNPAFDLLEGEDVASMCFQPAAQLRDFDLDDFKTTCFDIMDVSRETLQIVPGWVDDTIDDTAPKIEQVAILRLDIDFYEPTKLILENLYHKIPKGGYVICDDYGAWKGARKAVDDFREQQGITSNLAQTYKTEDMRVGTEWYWKVE